MLSYNNRIGFSILYPCPSTNSQSNSAYTKWSLAATSFASAGSFITIFSFLHISCTTVSPSCSTHADWLVPFPWHANSTSMEPTTLSIRLLSIKCFLAPFTKSPRHVLTSACLRFSGILLLYPISALLTMFLLSPFSSYKRFLPQLKETSALGLVSSPLLVLENSSTSPSHKTAKYYLLCMPPCWPYILFLVVL